MFVRWNLVAVFSLITFRHLEETHKINPWSLAQKQTGKKHILSVSQLDGLYNRWILPVKWWRDFLVGVNEDSVTLLLLVILLSCCQRLGALHLFHIGTKTRNEHLFHSAPGVRCTDIQIRKNITQKRHWRNPSRSGSMTLPVENCFVDGFSHGYHSNMVFVYLHIFICIKTHVISVIYVFLFIFFLKPILINVEVGQCALTRGWEVGQQWLQ